MLVKNVKIIGVEVEGFKGIKALRRVVLDEGKNIFEGSNEVGKTSFLEAITWALTGLSVEGKNKGVKFLNDDSERARCLVTFLGDGKARSIERIQSKSLDSEKKGTTILKLDGKDISQTKLNEVIPSHIVCLSNIMFFLELEPRKQREFISKIMPTLSTQSVVEKLAKTYQSFPVELYEDTSKSLKFLNTQRLNLEKRHTLIEQQVKTFEEIIPKSSGDIKETQLLEQSIIEKEGCIRELLSSQPQGVLDITESFAIKDQLEKKIVSLRSDGQLEKIDHLKQKQKQVEKLLQQEMEKQYIESPQINLLEQQKDFKLESYKRYHKEKLEATEEYNTIEKMTSETTKGTVCPCCQETLISNQSISNTNNFLNQLYAKRKEKLMLKLSEIELQLTQIKEEGVRLKEQIVSLKKQSYTEKDCFEKKKAEAVENLNKTLLETNQELEDLKKQHQRSAQTKKDQIIAIQKQIADLEIEAIREKNKTIIATFEAEKQNKIKTIEETLKQDKEALTVAQRHNQTLIETKKTKQNLEKQIKALNEEDKGVQKQLKEINQKLKAVKRFVFKKQEMINSQLKLYLKDVRIELEKINSDTGEVDECFEIYYKNKELKKASLSGKMRTGIELAAMIFKLTGMHYFIFIDNAESLEHYTIQEDIQVIETRMTPSTPFGKIKQKNIIQEALDF